MAKIVRTFSVKTVTVSLPLDELMVAANATYRAGITAAEEGRPLTAKARFRAALALAEKGNDPALCASIRAAGAKVL